MASIATIAAPRALDRPSSLLSSLSTHPPPFLPCPPNQSLASGPSRSASTCPRPKGFRCAGTSPNGAATTPSNGSALGLPGVFKAPNQRNPARTHPQPSVPAPGQPASLGSESRGPTQEPRNGSTGSASSASEVQTEGGQDPEPHSTPLLLARGTSTAPGAPASAPASAGASAKGAAAAAPAPSPAPSTAAASAAAAAAAAAPATPRTRPLTVQPLREALGEAGKSTPVDAMRVAYMGVPGAFGEVAAARAYPHGVPVAYPHFENAFQAVEQWLVDRAVLPIENSLGGSIHRNYDLLLRHRLHIVGEVQLPVTHCLLALPGTSISELTRVVSHPQALSQCEVTLFRLGIGTREAVDSTAGAAKMVAEGRLQGVAAIASSRAAELYGLQILAEGIQDGCDNITRFMALARDPMVPRMGARAPTKTSIVFALAKGPGGLFKALSVFALRDLNLTKVESRPRRDKPLLNQLLFEEWQRTEAEMRALDLDCATSSPTLLIHGIQTGHEHCSGEGGMESQAGSNVQMFDYIFYADIQASLADTRLQNALRHLKEFAPFIRVLGSYSMDTGRSSS